MATEEGSKLFIGGLPDVITEPVLRQLFEAAGGTVVDVTLPKDRNTGRPRGFGFVTLSSAGEASAARESLDGSMQSGRPISVRPFNADAPRPGAAAGGSQRNDERTLYVGNLPYDASREEIEGLIGQVGPVVRVHLPAGVDGRPRGFGFVTTGSTDVARDAVEQLRDTELRGRRLSISIAQPRGAPSHDRTDRGDRGDRGDRRDRGRPPSSRATASSPAFDRPTPQPVRFPDAGPPPEARRASETRRADPTSNDDDRSKKKKKRASGRAQRFESQGGGKRGGGGGGGGGGRSRMDPDRWDDD
jgi:nucleolin